jgi:GT2 family glycosyltransferase
MQSLDAGQRVLISVPLLARGNIVPGLCGWLIRMSHIPGVSIDISPYPGPLDACRNRMVQKLLSREEEWLLMVDADIVPPDNALFELLSHEKEIVSAPSLVRKGNEAAPLILRREGEEYRSMHNPEGLTEVDATGTGCILVHRSVFQRIPPPWFEFVLDQNGLLKRGEDFEFCERARSAGFSIYVDCDLLCEHTGVIVPH